jgi:hypothetical protein
MCVVCVDHFESITDDAIGMSSDRKRDGCLHTQTVTARGEWGRDWIPVIEVADDEQRACGGWLGEDRDAITIDSNAETTARARGLTISLVECAQSRGEIGGAISWMFRDACRASGR